MVAWNMSEAKHVIRTIRIAPRDDVTVLLLCFSLTVLFDMTIAVAVGIGLAPMLFIGKSICLTQASAIAHDHEGYQLPDSIMVYDINGPLFFGSAQKTLKTVSSVRPDVRVVVLEMTRVTMLDMSAIIAMESISNDLHKRGIGMVINGLQPRMILKLRRAGIRRQVGRVEFSRTLGEGFVAAKSMQG